MVRSAARLLSLFAVLGLLALFGPRAEAQSVSGGNLIYCNKSKVYDASATAVVIARGNAIYICGYVLYAGGTTTLQIQSGTGTTCGTGTVNLTPAFQFTAQTGAVDPAMAYRGMTAAAGTDVCIANGSSAAGQGIIYYAQ